MFGNYAQVVEFMASWRNTISTTIQMDEISTNLITHFKPSIPVEFARKPRRLDCIKLWKATEFNKINITIYGAIGF